MIKIFIDPGHGGHDPGAVGYGLREKDLTLAIAKKMRDMLSQYSNVVVKLSREDDRYLSLSQRAKMANDWGADIFISIHINAGGGVGFESFIFNGNVSEATRANQNVIHQEIIRATGWNDRGKKRANFAVLRQTKMPGLLTENGFISNASDAAKLKQDSFLNKIAQGHVDGLAKAFGLKPKKSAKVINFYTGGYRGSGLAKIHEFLLQNNFWYKPMRLSDGSMAFLIGGFTVNGPTYNKMKEFLEDNKYYYDIRE